MRGVPIAAGSGRDAGESSALVDLDDATLLAVRLTGGSESHFVLEARPPPPRDVASSTMGMYDRRQGRRCALRAEQSVQSEPFFKQMRSRPLRNLHET